MKQKPGIFIAPETINTVYKLHNFQCSSMKKKHIAIPGKSDKYTSQWIYT